MVFVNPVTNDEFSQGVGHGHVHYKVLLKFITPKAFILPVDNDILYKDDCIRSIIVTITISRKAVAAIFCNHYNFVSLQWPLCFSL